MPSPAAPSFATVTEGFRLIGVRPGRARLLATRAIFNTFIAKVLMRCFPAACCQIVMAVHLHDEDWTRRIFGSLLDGPDGHIRWLGEPK